MIIFLILVDLNVLVFVYFLVNNEIMKNKFLIITTVFVVSICLGVAAYFVMPWIVAPKMNLTETEKIEIGNRVASNKVTTSTQDILQKGVASSTEETTSWSAKIPLLPATLVKELASKDVKISFAESVYLPDPIPGMTNAYRVYNFPPRDAGNDAWTFSTTTNWIISIEENFVYKPDYAMKCVSSIEKVTIDGRLVNICRGGWDNDMYGINAFIFDDVSKAMVSVSAASVEAKNDAISVIESSLKWK